jgi:hypothetical protein
LSHDELVGVKCRWNRGSRSNYFLIAGVLWVALSQIRCRSSSAGTVTSMVFQNGETPGGGAGENAGRSPSHWPHRGPKWTLEAGTSG